MNTVMLGASFDSNLFPVHNRNVEHAGSDENLARASFYVRGKDTAAAEKLVLRSLLLVLRLCR